MFASDTWGPPAMALNSIDRAEMPHAAYPRSAVEDFLVDAAAEQARLERNIADAHQREERALAAVAETKATAELIRSALQELRAELEARSDEVESHVDAIVGKARDTAATILAEARAEAAAS